MAGGGGARGDGDSGGVSGGGASGDGGADGGTSWQGRAPAEASMNAATRACLGSALSSAVVRLRVLDGRAAAARSRACSVACSSAAVGSPYVSGESSRTGSSSRSTAPSHAVPLGSSTRHCGTPRTVASSAASASRKPRRSRGVVTRSVAQACGAGGGHDGGGGEGGGGEGGSEGGGEGCDEFRQKLKREACDLSDLSERELLPEEESPSEGPKLCRVGREGGLDS